MNEQEKFMKLTDEEIDAISYIAAERIHLKLSKNTLTALKETMVDYKVSSDKYCIGEMRPNIWCLYFDASDWHVHFPYGDGSHSHAEAWGGASLLAKLVERHAGAHTGTPYLLLRRLPLFGLYEIRCQLLDPRALSPPPLY